MAKKREDYEWFKPWNDEVAPRMSQGYFTAARMLNDGKWHNLNNVRGQMLTDGDLTSATCANLLSRLALKGLLEKRHGPKQTRYYRVTDLGRRLRPELRGTVEPLVRDETTTVVK